MLVSERLPIYASSCVHDNLGWKNQTTIYSAASLALRVIFIRHKRPQIYVSGMMILGERTEQHALMGFGEMAAVD